MVNYIKENWKVLAGALLVILLIFVNVRLQDKASSIIAENQKINTQYQELLKRETIYNSQIAEYKSEIQKKDSAINLTKQEITKTEVKLQSSQDEAKRLAYAILHRPGGTVILDGKCDSLAVAAIDLSNQVDTLKGQNKHLVKDLEQKSVLQDSIIAKKDLIIRDKSDLLDTSIKDYNKATVQLGLTEKKLNTEKKRKSFWKKAAIGLGTVVAGLIYLK